MNKKIIIFGGGTVSHIKNHLALCAPAYGSTAKRINELIDREERFDNFDVEMKLTKMAGGPLLETNDDIEEVCRDLINDSTTKIIIMSAALCDYEPESDFRSYGKYEGRFNTAEDLSIELTLIPAPKIISEIRKKRKDIFLVGFKTTCGKTEDEQYLAGLNLCKTASCNLVVANDTKTRLNMVITPEEARYHVTKDRDVVLKGMLDIMWHRSHLTFTRSTVVDGKPIPWDSDLIPNSLKTVVNYCILEHAYKPFNGVTAGHFACKLDDTTFLSSIRKTNFNKLNNVGLVKVKTDGPDTVLAYGAKPSVGGQSQRIVFRDHPGMDCIVHFHCEKKQKSQVPTVSQREYECGSMGCGENTSKGLKEFGNLKAVYLDNHGPNIVFNRNINPMEVIAFIEENFDLDSKTGGLV